MENNKEMATNRQLFALWLASGKSHDYRNDNLTKEQASALLDEFNKNSGYTKESKKKESKPRLKTEPKPKANKFGVKVGDVFHMSWGWEETHNDFFQVVELVGETSVRVKDVCLEMIEDKPTCSMAADRVFALPKNGEMMPVNGRSIWIKDTERGDLKRLKSYAADGVSNPCFNVENHLALYCQGDRIKVYESWYG